MKLKSAIRQIFSFILGKPELWLTSNVDLAWNAFRSFFDVPVHAMFRRLDLDPLEMLFRDPTQRLGSMLWMLFVGFTWLQERTSKPGSQHTIVMFFVLVLTIFREAGVFQESIHVHNQDLSPRPWSEKIYESGSFLKFSTPKLMVSSHIHELNVDDLRMFSSFSFQSQSLSGLVPHVEPLTPH